VEEGNERAPRVTSDMLQFVRERVLSVTDLTRTPKLTEILDSYANRLSTEVFVVQNTRNKNAQAVIADLEYFQELLFYKEAVEQSIDNYMYRVALDRENDSCEVPLEQVIEGLNFTNRDLEDIVGMVGEDEEED
jgi:hypothetical protein